MTQSSDSAADRELTAERSRAMATVDRGGRGLARPPLPITRRLEPREIIAVDVDERMDEAAAIEAAAPLGESLWRKTVRTIFVGLTGTLAWFLLPHEAPPKPPIELPDALQPVAMAEQPADREAEARAIDALAKDGPNAALPLMRKSIASNQATHRVWRTYLNVLETLSLNEELLEKARVYATRHPDRLEAAHFLARGLLRQDINKYRTGWSGYISQAFKADLAAAQKRLEQACDLLDKHKGDWSHKSRTAWRSLLLLDRASLYEQQWKCEGAPVAHEFRDAAIEALEKLQAKNARNAIELRLRIYKEIERQMWSWSSSKVVINGKAYSKQLLADRIKELEENLRQNHEDDES